MLRIRNLSFLVALTMPLAALAQDDPAPSPPPPAAVTEPDLPAEPKLRDRFYVGGWLGGSYGDVISSVQIAPEIGFIVVPRFHLGGSVVYRYRKDKRFEPDLSTTNVGGSLFGRYFVYAPIFLQAGVEQLDWEYVAPDADGIFSTFAADHTAVLLGPGFALPIGPGAATYMTFLYDVNYDSDGPYPYDRPWMIRVGVGIGL